mmetsp:Transcript_25126/g.38650  ORF Transcript_25126/g.38650 Transcript_25126/m.38650 type:complete len:392 (+) Transcript_25126:667-1842(+)
MAGCLDRIAQWTNNFLSRCQTWMVQVRKILVVCLSCNSKLVTIKESVVNHELDYSWCTPNILHVFHHIFSRWLEVSQKGSLVGNSLKVIESNGNIGILNGSAHCNKMEDSICGSSSNHNHGDSVFKGFLGHNVARFDILFQQHLHGCTCLDAFVLLFLRISRRTGRIWQRHSQSFNGSCHGVSGVHSSTSSLSRTRVLCDFFSFFFRDLFVNVLSIGLEGRYNIQCGTGRWLLSSTNGSSINHNSRSVESSHGHDTARHVLVTSWESNKTVVPLTSHGSFDTVRNQVSALKGKSHSGGSHGHSVTNSNRIEPVSNTSRIDNTLLDVFGKFQQMHVAGITFVPNRANSNLGLVHVFFFEPGSIQHGLGCSLRLWLGETSTVLVDHIVRLVHG